MAQKLIVDVLQTVVDQVSAEMVDYLKAIDINYTGVRFDYGHPADLIEKLTSLSKTEANRYKAYPMVGLFLDFPEKKGTDLLIDSATSLNMFIAVGTQKKYLPYERTQQTFKPILIPIRDKLIEKISDSPYISVVEDRLFKYTSTMRYQWGKGGLEYYNNGQKNIFNDFIDAIELTNFELNFLKNC
jgi:hypothetical protein